MEMVKFAFQLKNGKEIADFTSLLLDLGYKYIGLTDEITDFTGKSILTWEFKKRVSKGQYHLFVYEKRKKTGRRKQNKKRYVVVFGHYEEIVEKDGKIIHVPENPLAERKIIKELKRVNRIARKKGIASLSYKDWHSFHFTLRLKDYEMGIKALKEILRKLGYIYNESKRKYEKFASRSQYSTISIQIQQKKYLHFLITWGIVSRIDKKNRLSYKKAKNIGRRIIRYMLRFSRFEMTFLSLRK